MAGRADRPHLAQVATLAPLIEAHAESSERAGRMAPEVIDAFVEKGLFKLLVPVEFGGDEVSVPEALSIYEEVSRVDGAAGWTVMIGAGGGLFAAFLDPEGGREIFAPREAVIAGSGAPAGVAERVPGGYRATGRWQYASGAPHATWFTANCIIHENGVPIRSNDGQPLVRAMAVPAAQVEVIETWDTTGMRATSSHDMRMADVFVPKHHTFSAIADPPHIDRPLFRYPFFATACVTMAAVVLGIAGHALDLFHELALNKTPSQSSVPLAELPVTQERYAQAAAKVGSARAWLYETAQASWDRVAGGAELDTQMNATVQLASVHAARSATDAVGLLIDVAGMTPLARTSPLGRCWRDVHAASQNLVIAPARGYVSTGAGLLTH